MKSLFRFLLTGVLAPVASLSAGVLSDREPAAYSARLDGPLHDRMIDMATDTSGNVYIVGSFDSNELKLQVFGDAEAPAQAAAEKTGQTKTLRSQGGNDLFVAKYSPEGSLLWARSGGGPGHDYATGVAVDTEGNVYLTGSYSDTADIGGTTLATQLQTVSGSGRITSNGLNVQSEIFAAMLSPDGVWRWAKRLKYTLSNQTTAYAKFLYVDFAPNQPTVGYELDRGEGYGVKTGGTFGWLNPNGQVVNMTNQTDDDEEGLDQNFIHTVGNRWRVAVPAGTYRVKARSGDPDHDDSYYHTIAVTSENASQTLIQYDADRGSSNYSPIGTVTLTLANAGFIELREGPRADNNKLSWVTLDRLETSLQNASLGGVYGIHSGADAAAGKALALDAEGALYLKGRFVAEQRFTGMTAGSVVFLETASGEKFELADGGNKSGAGNSFITKLKPASLGASKGDPSAWEWDWLTPFGSGVSAPDEQVTIADLAIDPLGDVVVAGSWRGQLGAGGALEESTNNAPATANTEGFVVRLRPSDGTRNLLATIRTGQDNDVNRAIQPQALEVDARGVMYVLGNFNPVSGGQAFTGAWRFTPPGGGDPVVVMPGSTRDFFVAQLHPDGTWGRIAQPGGDGHRQASGLALDAGGALYVTGALLEGVTVFEPGSALTPTGIGAIEPFAAKVIFDGGADPAWAASVKETSSLEGRQSVIAVTTGSAPYTAADGFTYQPTTHFQGNGGISTYTEPLHVSSAGWSVQQSYNTTLNVTTLAAAEQALLITGRLTSGGSAIADAAFTSAASINFGPGTSGEFTADNPLSLGINRANSAVRATAELRVNVAGSYTIGVNNDDGGRLRIDGQDVIIDNAVHGPLTKTAEVSLSVGVHSIQYVFFNRSGDTSGEVFYLDGGGAKKLLRSIPDILNTNDDYLYGTERYGTDFSFNRPVANGTYDVWLKFAENYHAFANRRKFDVSIEGSQVIDDLDLFATVGRYAAHDRKYEVQVQDGELNIRFQGNQGTSDGNAIVSAIRIEPKGTLLPPSQHFGVQVAAAPNGTLWWLVSSGSRLALTGGTSTANQLGNRSEPNASLDTVQRTGGYLLAANFDLEDGSPVENGTGFYAGQEIPAPAGVASDSGGPLQPEIKIGGTVNADYSSYFYWDTVARKLYAVSPLPEASILWRMTHNPADPSRIEVKVATRWPVEGEPWQLHIGGAGLSQNEPSVDLSQGVNADRFSAVLFSTAGATANGSRLSAVREGWSTLLFSTGPDGLPGQAPAKLLAVRHRFWANLTQGETPVSIGEEITDARHEDPARNGFVVNEFSHFDGVGADAAHNRGTRQGPIIPVNEDASGLSDDLVVLWYQKNAQTGVYFPSLSVRYRATWPADAERIVITSSQGSDVVIPTAGGAKYPQTALDPAVYQQLRIYHQPDRTKPGYNPNEEHALIAESVNRGGVSVYALRNDLNHHDPANPGLRTSQPYVLAKYQDATAGKRWKMKVYHVELTGAYTDGADSVTFDFSSYRAIAGTQVQPPWPLPILGGSTLTQGSGDPYWIDRNGTVWARCAGATPTETATMTVGYYYPLKPDFWYHSEVTEVPWLEFTTAAEAPQNATPAGRPIDIHYTVSWPADIPKLFTGDTLTRAKNGLPDIRNWVSADIIYDANDPNIGHFEEARRSQADPFKLSARLLDAFSTRSVPFAARVAGVTLDNSPGQPIRVEFGPAGKRRLTDLPPHLKSRVLFNPNGGEDSRGSLEFAGVNPDDPSGGSPILINVISPRERDELLALDDPEGAPTTGSSWDNAVRELYLLTRNPNHVAVSSQPTDGLYYGLRMPEDAAGSVPAGDVEIDSIFGGAALTAGLGSGTGFMTLAENNHPSAAGSPVSLKIVEIANPPVIGSVFVIFSDNVFDERVTLRHSSDFGGDPSHLFFEWFYKEDDGGALPTGTPPADASWQMIESGFGLNSIIIRGAGVRTLSDGLVYVRYRGYDAGGFDPDVFTSVAGDRSGTAAQPRPALVNGWIARVTQALNPFDQRVSDFHSSSVQTYASMIQQAGHRYEGDIALNPGADNVNSLGLIELYETVLRRGLSLSINGTGGVSTPGVDKALLLAASRISDLYMLLGNEAYGDAQDPTIGYNAPGSNDFGTMSSSVFAFQNQVPSLIDEELALLRGRDETGAGVAAAPFYNRLLWNFTNGLEGEPAYVLNYGITNLNADAVIDAQDAALLYPQGHGDAWGHYLSASKAYYRLLRHPGFAWEPRSDRINIAAVAVEVDYLDEVKFAKAAAAKARAGREIVDLTYRDAYVANPAGQWQGYKDTDAERAWGVDEWARRAGQAAYFDWAVANAILPETSAKTGLEKIDRTSVSELREIATQARSIQAKLDEADGGLSPLGLTTEAIPFDIDPSLISSGVNSKTHFEQVYDRASKAVQNALRVYDFANLSTQRIRAVQLESDKFRKQVQDQERAYKNQLIEIFGYPHEGDIGAGRLYPSGYDGPDLYHWMYVDVAEYSEDDLPEPEGNFEGYFSAFTFGPLEGAASLENHQQLFFPQDAPGLPAQGQDQKVAFPVLTIDQKGASRWAFQKTAGMGLRRAPGKLQQAIGVLIQKEIEMQKAVGVYNSYLMEIQDEVGLIQMAYGRAGETLRVLRANEERITSLADEIARLTGGAGVMSATGDTLTGLMDAISEMVPESVGTTSFDALSVLRGGIKLTGAVTNTILGLTAAGMEASAASAEAAKETAQLKTDITIEKINMEGELLERIKALEQKMRDESDLRVEVYQRQLDLDAAAGSFRQALAEGERLMEERLIYNQQVTGPIQQLRYQDLAFRNFRNDALQKYRASFDLAARYVYLAARAYDYETCLLDRSNGAGANFLTNIVRQRALGQFINGVPVNGVNGLSDPMARLSQNFDVLKGQLGFNNPQTETGRFSLRTELFRIGDDSRRWRETLQRYRVPDLWQVPEFRRFCRSFAPEAAGPQPGLVIPFNTDITFGLNFFGWPLAGGDSSYDSSNFATKIRSVGVWFDNYDGRGLSTTPRVYLVPAGLDIMRSPTGYDLATREFSVFDQRLPIPFPLGQNDLVNAAWRPVHDTLDGSETELRRYNRFRAYHDAGFNLGEMTTDSRLIGRSVWNTRWVLIIPGGTFLNDPTSGLDTFINGRLVPGSSTQRDENGIADIKLFFQTYAYSGF